MASCPGTIALYLDYFMFLSIQALFPSTELFLLSSLSPLSLANCMSWAFFFVFFFILFFSFSFPQKMKEK